MRSDAKGRLFSSGAGSGKSALGCRESIRWAAAYPGSRNGIFRLTASQLVKTTMVTFWKEMRTIGYQEGTHYEHNRSLKEITWDNGSVTIYGHLEEEEGLGSLELNSAFVDEGSEVPDNILTFLYSTRLRWHLTDCDQQERVIALQDGASDEELAAVKCPCPRGMWVCTNPGASGYLEKVTEEKVPGWEWIKAAPGDNPYNGPEYYDDMRRLREINGEAWFKRYYNGDWDSFEGQRFPMFDRSRHILATPFRPSGEYRIVEGVDFGQHTFVVWLAYRPDRAEPVVCFHEFETEVVQAPEVVAAEVKHVRDWYGITPTQVVALGDPRSAVSTQFSAVTPYAAYGALGWHISPAKSGRDPVGRADMIAAFLVENQRQYDGSYWPGLVFGPNCPAVVRSIVNLRWKPASSRLGEDAPEKFLDRDKHGVDAIGYALLGVPPPSLPASKPRLPRGVNISHEELVRLRG